MPSSRNSILKIASTPTIENFVRHSFLFRPLVHRFVAGDTLEETFPQIEALAEKGFFVSLDNLGENFKTVQETDNATELYIQILNRIAKSPLASLINISIKLTECGLDQDEELAKNHYHQILERALSLGIFVRVDMEGSAYTESTLRLVQEAFKRYPNTGTVLQTSLYRTEKDAADLTNAGIRVRLVKGAYLEPENVAYQSKHQVDEQYLKIAKYLLKEAPFPAFATHDEHIIAQVKYFADKEKIAKDQFEFQMLYGIRRDLQQSLKEEGYQVRIYTPFGQSWYPYFTRRLAERPANLFFVLKSLLKG